MGCRRRAPAAQLVRLRLTPGGVLTTGAGSGRGAWLCRGSATCAAEARRRRGLDRALRVAFGAEALAALEVLVGAAGLPGEAGSEVWEDRASGRTAGARLDTGKGS